MALDYERIGCNAVAAFATSLLAVFSAGVTLADTGVKTALIVALLQGLLAFAQEVRKEKAAEAGGCAPPVLPLFTLF
jgi:hypothetical protein